MYVRLSGGLKVIVRLLAVCASLFVVCSSASLADADNEKVHPVFRPGPVTSDQALDAVKRMLKGKHEVNYVGEQTRTSNPPHSLCHVFKVTLDYKRPPGVGVSGPYPEAPLTTTVFVEKSTGRILQFMMGGHVAHKYADRKFAEQSKLITSEQAEAIAGDCLRQAGLYSDGTCLYDCELHGQTSDNYISYSVRFSKSQPVEGVGSILLPECVPVTVDAQTGEVEKFWLLSNPLLVKIEAPAITGERAIEVARDVCKAPVDVPGDAKLVVLGDWWFEEEDRQIFCWEVTFRDEKAEGIKRVGAHIDPKTGAPLQYTSFVSDR